MHLSDRINSGMIFYEHGHTDPIDIQQEKQLQEERDHCKEMMFEYNNTHPREDDFFFNTLRISLSSLTLAANSFLSTNQCESQSLIIPTLKPCGLTFCPITVPPTL